jgi:hypothetical protein
MLACLWLLNVAAAEEPPAPAPAPAPAPVEEPAKGDVLVFHRDFVGAQLKVDGVLQVYEDQPAQMPVRVVDLTAGEHLFEIVPEDGASLSIRRDVHLSEKLTQLLLDREAAP